MKVVVVESPAKAKTIHKYLGSDYKVLASYGHVRDLPPRDGSVKPDDGFTMSWQSNPKSDKQMREIRTALKSADHLVLATDPDREGEAISWHVHHMLEEKRALEGVSVERVVFNEVTKSAVLDAMANPRSLDQDLVDAYLARRALDYLVGFTLSPVLWRKLPGSRSAGRVQSVALRLVCERESEIEIFRPEEFWTIEVAMRTLRDRPFAARLTHVDGRKLEKFDLANEADAQRAATLIENSTFTVAEIERKRVRRHPQPPFTTSTLQQEASRKLGMGATRTMRTAQHLYEGVEIGGETTGLITYMRTDGVQVSQESVTAIRTQIRKRFGAEFVPGAPRIYRSKAKNAQEAHEAIRPTDASRHPNDMAAFLGRDQLQLYELVWKRAVASQMASAELDQTAVIINAADGRTTLRANGSIVTFEGFFKLYQEDRDDPAAESDKADNRLLPGMNKGEDVNRDSVKPEQHFTQPPPRFTEASLVKRLEELGIGRPSTYASILQVLQDRNYVRLEKKRFVPEDRGRLVTAFLTSFFSRYVEYNFTADLETELDEISDGKLEWKTVLDRFWQAFNQAIGRTMDLSAPQVLETIDSELGRHFFPAGSDRELARTCPRCENGRLGLKISRYGAFIGCANYPECRFTKQVTTPAERDVGDGAEALDEPRILGQDPATDKDVSLRKGPYGVYVQLGEQGEKKSDKPKRASLLRDMPVSDVTLASALRLLSLPREVGQNPNTGEMIAAGIGRYGPYLRHADVYTSIPEGDDVLTIGLNRAVDLIANDPKNASILRTLGDSGKDRVIIRKGRYGPYVQRGRARANLPKTADVDTLTLEGALELLKGKTGQGRKKSTGAKSGAKTGTKNRASRTATGSGPRSRKTSNRATATGKSPGTA